MTTGGRAPRPWLLPHQRPWPRHDLGRCSQKARRNRRDRCRDSIPDVIALVGPTYDADPRLTIVHADAFAYQPPPGRRYAMVWSDIWDRISATNLDSMAALMRKYEPIADWQGCWAEDQSIRCAAREAANTPAAAELVLRYLQSSVQPPRELPI